MNIFIIVILVLIILISLFVMLFIQQKSKLEYYKIRVDKAEKEIETELDHRYDVIKKAQKAIEKNTKMDLKHFKEIDEYKEKTNISPIDYEKMLSETINTIYLIKDDYPKIAKRKDFKECIRELEESDTKIIAAKSFYNENNKKLIELIKKFPSNIFALMFKIKIQPYYDVRRVFNEKDDGISI